MANAPYGQRLIVALLDETAKVNPNKTLAAVPRTTDLSEGWRDISFAETAGAVNKLSWWLKDTTGLSNGFETVGYQGINDLRYLVFILAAIKVGFKTLLLSPRNQDADTVHLLKQTLCTKFFCSDEMVTKASALKSLKPDLEILSIPTYEELISEPANHYLYEKSWDNAVKDPIIVLQTSGTTGPPKAVVLTNEFFGTIDNHHYLVAPPGRHKFTLDSFTGRFYSMFPPFHAGGLILGLIVPLFVDSVMVRGPPAMIPNAELTVQAIRNAGVRKLLITPSVIEQLADDDSATEWLEKVDLICTGGGPTAQAAGDKISKITKFLNIFGQTETGFPPLLIPHSEDWAFFDFFPGTGSEFEQIEDNLFELVVRRDAKTGVCRYQTPFVIFPELETFHTKDLFTPHPSRPNIWTFAGRSDDIIALSISEKFNPIPMEVIIQGHPLLLGALVTGHGKPCSALLVEPKPDAVTVDLLEEIWSVVEKANAVVKKAARISKSMIAVTLPAKPFIRSPKGAIIRRHTIKQYEKELADMYVEGSSMGAGPLLEDRNSLESVTAFVKACILQVRKIDTLDSDADFFVLGMDSLEVLNVSFNLRRGLKAQNRTEVEVSDPSSISIVRMIYANPTINRLATATYNHLHLGGGQDAKSTEGKGLLETLVNKYTQKWPHHSMQRQTYNTNSRAVLLTGSTGSLGACLLSKLLLDPKIIKVFCLNRSKEAASRHALDFAKRGLPHSLLETKAVFLHSDFGQEDFGLSPEDYNVLKTEVDTIIHNAWQVDFNLSLDSFESVHIRGVRNFIDFSLSSPLLPRIYFTSSIGTAMLWKVKHGPTPIPEAVLEDSFDAMSQGYAQSKVVAERILSAAAKETSAPLTILRIGQIAGSTRETDPPWKEAEMIPSLIKTSRSLGKVPRTIGSRNAVNWMPVDTLSDAIYEMVLRKPSPLSTDVEVFNVVNPHPTSWASLLPVLGQDMEKLEVVEYVDWVDLLRKCDPDDTQGLKDRPAVKLLEFFENFEQGEPDNFGTDLARSVSGTMAAMEAVSPELVKVWMKQWAF